MTMRKSMTHRPGMADYYMALADTSLMEARIIEESGTASYYDWHIHGQLHSIARLAFDIQACILRAQSPDNTTQPESEATEMTTVHLPEVCDELSAAIVDIEQFIDNAPLNMRLQNSVNFLRTAIKHIDFADQEMHRFHQERVDQRAVEAIHRAIHDTFASDGNVEGARGMLMDIEASGSMILQAIRDAGYVISPAPPL